MNESSPYATPDNSATDALESPCVGRPNRSPDHARMFRIWQGDEAERENDAQDSTPSDHDSAGPGDVGPGDLDESNAQERLANTSTSAPNDGADQRAPESFGDSRFTQQVSDEVDDSDDIEAYMEQWLRRVRGQSEAQITATQNAATQNTATQNTHSHGKSTQHEPAPDKAAAVDRPADAGVGGAANDPGSATGPVSNSHSLLESSLTEDPRATDDITDRLGIPRELMPGLPTAAPLRSGKVERPAELQALREVANVSARAAINGSLRKQFRHEFRAKATVAGVALIVAGVLYRLSEETASILSVGAAACALISLFWGMRIVGDWFRMRRKRSLS